MTASIQQELTTVDGVAFTVKTFEDHVADGSAIGVLTTNPLVTCAWAIIVDTIAFRLAPITIGDPLGAYWRFNIRATAWDGLTIRAAAANVHRLSTRRARFARHLLTLFDFDANSVLAALALITSKGRFGTARRRTITARSGIQIGDVTLRASSTFNKTAIISAATIDTEEFFRAIFIGCTPRHATWTTTPDLLDGNLSCGTLVADNIGAIVFANTAT